MQHSIDLRGVAPPLGQAAALDASDLAVPLAIERQAQRDRRARKRFRDQCREG